MLVQLFAILLSTDPIVATFESECLALVPPVYGIYERGRCYVFDHTDVNPI